MAGMWDNLVAFFSHGPNLVFTVLAVVIISAAVLMINFNKIVHMVLSMALAFIGLGGLYILLAAEFVAIVQILIYGGALTILMIFGIMMTRHGNQDEAPKRPAFNALLLIGVIALFGILFYAIQGTAFVTGPALDPGADNTAALGELIFNNYVIPFELVSVLLTVAFIGAIVMAKREEE